MQQRSKDGYLEELSMEEYLTKRKKQREREERKTRKQALKADPDLLLLGL